MAPFCFCGKGGAPAGARTLPVASELARWANWFSRQATACCVGERGGSAGWKERSENARVTRFEKELRYE